MTLRRCACAILLLLCGCIADRPMPDPTTAASLIDYLQALRRKTSLWFGDAPPVPAPATDTPDYQEWSDHWCLRHTEVQSTDDVVKRVADYCVQKRGVFREPYCRSTSIPDHVVFYASFRRQFAVCQSSETTVSVDVVEPKLGRAETRGYVAKLHELGYRSSIDLIEDEAARRQQLAADQARAVREKPLLTNRGTRICLKQDAATYVGFVDDVSGSKIRVSVQQAYVGPARNGTFGTPDPNYKPQVLWDFPEHWRVCE